MPSDLEQTERAEFEHAGPLFVLFQCFAEGAFYGALLLFVPHIDKVADDQPAEVAKSKLTMVWTLTTSGVASAASSRYAVS